MSDAEQTQPGWYYAEGDPPGTHRYWDGELWHGEPRPVEPSIPDYAPPPPPGGTGVYPPAGYPPTPGYRTYREPSDATTALVVAILGLVFCQVLGPVGWSMGQKELDAIAAGRRDPSNRGTAQAAKIIGIITTVLLAIAIIGFVLLLSTGLSGVSI